MSKLMPDQRSRPRIFMFFAAVVAWLSMATLTQAQNDLDSKEYKLLLRVDRFCDLAAGAKAYWKGVDELGDELQIHVRGEVDDDKPSKRIVRFLDTEGFELRETHGYVFRERIALKRDGSKKKRKQITLKFRSADAALAKSKDVSSVAGDEDDRGEKFEEDIVAPRESRFSHSGETEVKTKTEFDEVDDIKDAFPGLASLQFQDQEILVVNGFKAHEVKMDAGKITLSDHHKAEASFTFWYDQPADGNLLVAEFSFDYDVKRGNSDDRILATRRADELFKKLQSDLHQWRDESAQTKTSIAYSAN